MLILSERRERERERANGARGLSLHSPPSLHPQRTRFSPFHTTASTLVLLTTTSCEQMCLFRINLGLSAEYHALHLANE